MKKRYLVLPLIIVILAILQASFVYIHLVLLFSLGFVILNDENLASVSAFLGGLVLDVLGRRSFGLYTLAMVGTVLAVVFLKKILPKSTYLYLGLIPAASVFFDLVIRLPEINLNLHPISLLKSLLAFAVLVPFVNWVYELFKKAQIRRN